MKAIDQRNMNKIERDDESDNGGVSRSSHDEGFTFQSKSYLESSFITFFE